MNQVDTELQYILYPPFTEINTGSKVWSLAATFGRKKYLGSVLASCKGSIPTIDLKKL